MNDVQFYRAEVLHSAL